MSTATTSAHLARLESSGLIQLAMLQPELAYDFRHVLVKDAAYASLVKGDRRRLHAQVAATLEQLYLGGRAASDKMVALLAYHFDEAGAAEPAARYYTQAGDAAVRLYANAEAAQHYRRALALLPAPADAHRLIYLHTRLGRTYEVTGQQPAALAAYQALEALGHARGEPALALAGLALRATLLALPSVVGNPTEALALATEALQQAREQGDTTTEARLLWTASLAANFLARPAQAVAYGEQALALARELDQRDLVAIILTDLGRAYLSLGEAAAGRAVTEEARGLWQAEGNLARLADTVSSLAGSYYFAGDYQHALGLLAESHALTRATGDAWGQAESLVLQCFVHLDMGKFDLALDQAEACVRLSTAAGFIYPQLIVPVNLSLLYSMLGQPERGLPTVEQALAQAQAQAPELAFEVQAALAQLEADRGHWTRAEALLAEADAASADDMMSFAPLRLANLRGTLALHQGQVALAEAQLRAAVTRFESTGVQVLVAELQATWAQALRRLGRLDEARAVLHQAHARVARQPTRRLLWRILADQAELAAEAGQAETAARLRAEAATVVAFMAEHLADDSLRQSFLARPEVLALHANPPLPA